MAVGDVYQVTLFFDLQGQTENIYQFYLDQTQAGGTPTVEEALNNWAEVEWITDMKPFFTPDKVFKCIETKKIFSSDVKDNVPELGRQESISIAGTNIETNSLSGQCSLVIQNLFDTTETDPSKRGRDFFTGFPMDAQVDGIWEAVQYASFETAFVAVMKPTITHLGGGWIWTNFSHTLNKARIAQDPATPEPSWIDPVSHIGIIRALKHVRTQRRRQSMNPCDKYFTLVDLTA